MLDVVRWGLNKKVHPIKIHCEGGHHPDADSDQEVPMFQFPTLKYGDGTMIDVEGTTLTVRNSAAFIW